jgi:hypothetical protein
MIVRGRVRASWTLHSRTIEKARQQKRQVVRLHPNGRRRSAEDEASAPLLDLGRPLRRDQEQRAVEANPAACRRAVGDNAELDRWIQLRRGRPCDIGRVRSERGGLGQALQIERDVVQMLAGPSHRDAER